MGICREGIHDIRSSHELSLRSFSEIQFHTNWRQELSSIGKEKLFFPGSDVLPKKQVATLRDISEGIFNSQGQTCTCPI